ncbi:hypothetical protein DFR58_13634 [Anaerobacterium chartisolvens]|uniref:Uncharacterized protein n=1 Tax=Anaerobacterium chartisolvens TaxID=1297424 RepID=A0A369ALZ4_9FIRM|nr:hypothetical protein DFR58_13634 [Anaerobacterium chartisolvens]
MITVSSNKLGKYTFDAKDSSEADKSSAANLSRQSLVDSDYLGTTKFFGTTFSGYRYMETHWEKYHLGSTSYSKRTYVGTMAAFIAAISVSLGVGYYIAGSVAGAIVSAGIGLIIGDTLNINTSIHLSSEKYSHKFISFDAINPRMYNTSSNVTGYEYRITDIEHQNELDNIYYEGLTRIDYENQVTQLFQSMFMNVYGINGTPVF